VCVFVCVFVLVGGGGVGEADTHLHLSHISLSRGPMRSDEGAGGRDNAGGSLFMWRQELPEKGYQAIVAPLKDFAPAHRSSFVTDGHSRQLLF
jgi:hypothetical protein